MMRIARLITTVLLIVTATIGCASGPRGTESPLTPPTKVELYRIEGINMAPSLHVGDYVAVDRSAYANHRPERGDIVMYGRAENQLDIQRVIGLPGESIEVRAGKVWINGAALDEPYLMNPIRYDLPARSIEADHYFVLGDNRNNSQDSHSFGAIPIGDIVGRAVPIDSNQK